MEKIETENREKIYSVLQKELNIYLSYYEVKNYKLEELDLTKPEINLLLNQLESVFHIEIREGVIALDLTVHELMQRILQNQKKLEFNHVAEVCV